MIGWIKLHRKLKEWEWADDPLTLSTFIHMLLEANFTEGNYKGHKIGVGQFPFGRKAWSARLGMSEQSLRTVLKRLEKSNEITIKSTNKFSVITVNNYNLYQDANQQDNQQLTNNQPATNHTIKKEEGKKEKNNIGDSQTSQEKAALTRALTSEFDSEVWDNLKTYSNNKYDGSLKQYLALRRNGYTKDEISKCYYDLELVNRNDPSYARQLCKVITLTNIKQWKKDLDNNLKEQNKQAEEDKEFESNLREIEY